MDIARAWKDADYRRSLSAEQLADFPESPVGSVELDDEDLADLGGGAVTTIPCAVTAAGGCFTIGNTVCNGTCKVAGTQGCCPA